MMDGHKYHLQRYQGMSTRKECPQCGDRHSFALYVDDMGNPIDEHVGRCNHESGCGYHYTPSQFFADHPELKPGKEMRNTPQPPRRMYYRPQPLTGTRPQKIDTIPFEYVERSTSFKSSFIRFLCNLFDIDTIQRLVEYYAIGATKSEDVIFWQIDSMGRVRSGKIIKYNPHTGHRIKDDGIPVDWVHSRMKKNGMLPGDWNISQCLFGEHLLRSKMAEGKSIALVESEKSAIIGAGAFPQYLWMATGGIGNLNEERMQAIKDRNIIIFPDVDGFSKWREKASKFAGYHIMISDILERNATQEERDAKIDIADWIIKGILDGEEISDDQTIDIEDRTSSIDDPVADMVKTYPIVSKFIERLDLRPIAL